MRISKKNKLVFMSIPKTGSLSGFRFMEDNFNAKNYGGKYHEVIVPSFALNYRIFCFIRNPYDRFVSLWHSVLIAGKLNPAAPTPSRQRKEFLKYLKGNDDILSLAKYMASNKTRRGNKYLFNSQTDYLNRSNVTDKISKLRVENLQEEFNNWFGTDKFIIPHYRKREHLSWEELKTPKLTDLINKIYSEDFDNLGYEKE